MWKSGFRNLPLCLYSWSFCWLAMQGQFSPMTAELKLIWCCMCDPGAVWWFLLSRSRICLGIIFICLLVLLHLASVVCKLCQNVVYVVCFTQVMYFFVLFVTPKLVCPTPSLHFFKTLAIVCSLCCQPMLVPSCCAHTPLRCSSFFYFSRPLLFQACIRPH